MIDRPFIVLTETKLSKRHIPVWARKKFRTPGTRGETPRPSRSNQRRIRRFASSFKQCLFHSPPSCTSACLAPVRTSTKGLPSQLMTTKGWHFSSYNTLWTRATVLSRVPTKALTAGQGITAAGRDWVLGKIVYQFTLPSSDAYLFTGHTLTGPSVWSVARSTQGCTYS